jgi:hypothetical protein
MTANGCNMPFVVAPVNGDPLDGRHVLDRIAGRFLAALQCRLSSVAGNRNFPRRIERRTLTKSRYSPVVVSLTQCVIDVQPSTQPAGRPSGRSRQDRTFGSDPRYGADCRHRRVARWRIADRGRGTLCRALSCHRRPYPIRSQRRISPWPDSRGEAASLSGEWLVRPKAGVARTLC